MPLGTLDRTPPPFFKQGPSALSRLIFFSALAVFLMVADTRLRISQPVRATVSVIIYPLQWLILQPVQAARHGAQYFSGLQGALADKDRVQRQLVEQGHRAQQVEQLVLETRRLRALLDLRPTASLDSQTAEVLYDAADPHARRVIIDRGMTHGITAGAPIIDERGVIGQVTRVYPLVSEVTLLSDRDQAIPILNTRTGARGVAYGDPQTAGGSLELRFMPASADVQAGDLLTTSGVDGVYPAGLAVATIVKVERRADSPFARIICAPTALMAGSRHVLVLKPVVPPAPLPEVPATPAGKGTRK